MNPAKLAKLHEQLSKDERDMRRAFRKYEKTRAQVERAHKSLDKEFTRKADAGDVRDLGTEEQHERARKLGIAPRKHR